MESLTRQHSKSMATGIIFKPKLKIKKRPPADNYLVLKCLLGTFQDRAIRSALHWNALHMIKMKILQLQYKVLPFKFLKPAL